MLIETSYDQSLTEINKNLPQGAFLTVQDDKQKNTMTIGWALIGYIWRVPVIQVMVRQTRHTYQIIENTDEFTVSFVFDDRMKKELSFCGTKSGRNYNKFQECNLDTISSKEVQPPLIKNCDFHYECKIKHKQELKRENMSTDIIDSCYKNNNLHTLYYGEIVKSYQEDN